MGIAIARSFAILDSTAYTTAPEDRVALIDSDGTIVGVNEKWILLAERTGARMERVGREPIILISAGARRPQHRTLEKL
jgi:hypothetical protein